MTNSLRPLSIAAALAIALLSSTAMAQEHHTTGLKLATPAQLQSVPETPIYRDFLPQAVDLSRYFPTPGDQGAQGSCVGWATGYAARAYYAYQVEHRQISDLKEIPSPAYIFNVIHRGDCENGTLYTDAFDVLENKGALSLADYPYTDTACPAPTAAEEAKASDFKIAGYLRIDTTDLDQVKAQLASGNPVLVGAIVNQSFQDFHGPRGLGLWEAAPPEEGENAGHAFTLVGYDDANQVFKFINSWGTEWGDNGYGRMSYQTFENRIDEAYVLQMPGDPQVVLQQADFQADPVTLPPTERTDASTGTMRAFGAPVEVTGLQCGKVDVITNADGSTTATGFVGTKAELDSVKAQLKGKVGSNEVALAPWPACEVRLTLAAQLGDTDAPQVAVAPDAPKTGDSLSIAVTTPGFASYLYAAYFSADGSVLNITQPNSTDLKPKAAHAALGFGGEDDPMTLKVQPPVGDEELLVLASEKPLFGAARPDTETSRQFLSGLREAVLAGDAGRVTATLVPVTTSDK